MVLVVDDQPEIARLVQLTLREKGMTVVAETDGRAAVDRAVDVNPDLVVLDLALGPVNGLDVLEEMRSVLPTPVILLTARSSPPDVRRGLDLGADDYLGKPFHPRELVARINAVLRRVSGRPSADIVVAGELAIDVGRRAVMRAGRRLPLSRTDWLLLQELVRRPGRLVLHHELLAAAWGPAARDDVIMLRTSIRQLRRKLGVAPWEEGPIRTVQGLGYAFDPEGSLPRMRSRRPRSGSRAGGRNRDQAAVPSR